MTRYLSISKKMAILVLITGVFITLFPTFFEIKYLYNEQIENQLEALADLVKGFEPSLNSAIIKKDEGAIKGILSDLLETKIVDFAELKFGTTEPLQTISFGVKQSIEISNTFQLVSEDSTIGMITLQTDRKKVIQNILNIGAIVLLSRLIQIITLTLLTLWIIHRMILRHLSKIKQFLRETSLDQENQQLQLGPKLFFSKSMDEINEVVEILNEIKSSLTSYTHGLEKIIGGSSSSQSQMTAMDRLSHDLRTPLSNIIGLVELELEDKNSTLPLRQLDTLEKIYSSSLSLNNRLDEAILFRRLRENSYRSNIKPANFKEIVEILFEKLKPTCETKKIELKISFNNIESEIMCDSYAFKKILHIVSRISIHRMKHGFLGIFIGKEGDGKYINVTLADTAPHFLDEEMNSFFEPYSKIISEVQDPQLTGQSLAIAAMLAQYSGKHLYATNLPDGGTCYKFSIKVSSDNKIESQIQKPNKNLENLKILVVDDNNLNREIVIRLLEKTGCHADSTDSGRDAIFKARHENFDVIFLDIEMPVIDGFQVSREIRQLGLKKEPIIVAMTANTDREYHDLCIATGMNDFLNKPVNRNIIKKILHKYFQIDEF